MIYFIAHTFKCVCHCIRVMFRVLGMYNFGWGLEREHNGLKSFIFLSCKTEVNKVLNAPSEMISLNWKMHGVAVNTPCLYMDLDDRKNYPLLIYSSRRSKFIRNPKQTWFLNSYEGFLTLYISFSSTWAVPETYFEYNH